MNLPNKLTLSRIILTFVFMFFLFSPGTAAKYLALITFTVASLTDLYDGRIARNRKLVTDFGKLMDPVADKILVLAAFLAFVELKIIPAWTVVLIIARESIITGLRLLATTKKTFISADRGGKHKTVSQIVTIFTILGFIAVRETAKGIFSFWTLSFEIWFRRSIFYFMLITVLLTFTSGISYLWNNRNVFMQININTKRKINAK